LVFLYLTYIRGDTEERMADVSVTCVLPSLSLCMPPWKLRCEKQPCALVVSVCNCGAAYGEEVGGWGQSSVLTFIPAVWTPLLWVCNTHLYWVCKP